MDADKWFDFPWALAYNKVDVLIDTVEFDYPTFHLLMDCFWCQLIHSNLELLEAAKARWLTKKTLKSVEWLPADLGLTDKSIEVMYEKNI